MFSMARVKCASSRQNLFSGFPTKQDSSQSPQLQRLDGKFKICLHAVASLDERVTKALIRLRGSAGWSAYLKFTKTGFLASRPK